MKRITLEVELARLVVEWLHQLGWEVYQEVELSRYSRVADIVAVQAGKVWFVECKTAFGLPVIEQADYWRFRVAHYVSVAVPPSGRNTHRRHAIAEQFLRWRGIGLLTVDINKSVREDIAPSLNRRASVGRVLDTLTEQHKTYSEAGAANGRRWTPFRATCQAVSRAVADSPGIHMTELLRTVKTHYGSTSTARACIKHWAEAGKIDGVRLVRDGKLLRLYPDGYEAQPSNPMLIST
jgi:hypothetical protein